MKKVEEIHKNFINLLLEISKIEDKEKLNQKLDSVFTKYCKFCYKYNIDNREEKSDLYDLYSSTFLFPSAPILHEIDNDRLNRIIDKLENIITKKIVDGLTQDEANYLLKAVVMGVRDNFSKDRDIINSSLRGACGLGQGISFFLLDDLGIKTTLNNAISFPDCNNKHAFLTCFLPIKDENGISYKQYLVDTTYRQFFTTIYCNEGNFYSLGAFKGRTSPDPGYYINRSLKSKKMAMELLANGFIELTLENARIYGAGFSFSSITLSTPKKDIIKIISHSGLEYIKAINDKNLQEEVDYKKEEFDEWDYNIDLRKVGKGNTK